jgi:hypothetical protein
MTPTQGFQDFMMLDWRSSEPAFTTNGEYTGLNVTTGATFGDATTPNGVTKQPPAHELDVRPSTSQTDGQDKYENANTTIRAPAGLIQSSRRFPCKEQPCQQSRRHTTQPKRFRSVFTVACAAAFITAQESPNVFTRLHASMTSFTLTVEHQCWVSCAKLLIVRRTKRQDEISVTTIQASLLTHSALLQ